MKAKTIKKEPSGRQAVKKDKTARIRLELLKMADKVDLQRYIAEGLSNRMARAMTTVEHLQDGGYHNLWPEDDILIGQFIRDKGMGLMSEDQIFAYINGAVEEIAKEDAKLSSLFEASEAKHREAGFGPDDEWPEETRPADVQELFDAYWDRFLQLKVAILRRNGEDAMADLLLDDPDAYQARVEKGMNEPFDKKKAKGITGS